MQSWEANEPATRIRREWLDTLAIPQAAPNSVTGGCVGCAAPFNVIDRE
ncbi:MAG TPA: hypothetical protein VIM69_06470 [Opitutaceae bacterium]